MLDATPAATPQIQETPEVTPSASPPGRVMSQRDGAIYMARQGLKVFRLKPGTKGGQVEISWSDAVTDDLGKVYDSWTDPATGEPLDWNVGVSLGEDHAGIDADCYKADGDASLRELGQLPATLTVRTPSGGQHLYFACPGGRFANSAGTRLGKGIDTRGLGGYLVGPGSIVNGKHYVIEDDAPIAPLPNAIRQRLHVAPERTAGAGTPIVELDTPDTIVRAKDYLRTAKPAIQDEAGDPRTIAVANGVLDFGLSVNATHELMLEHWNDRCVPTWDADELRYKIESARKTRRSPVGIRHPAVGFDTVEVLPAASPSTKPVDFKSRFTTLGLPLEAAKALPLRDWIVSQLVERGDLTICVAPGGSGKSVWFLLVAIATATGGVWRDGINVLGIDVPKRQKVLIVGTEDRLLDLKRRMFAACLHHGIDSASLDGWLDAYDASTGRLVLVAPEGSRGRKVTDDAHHLRDFIVAGGYGLVLFDPFVKLHGLKENDNDDMNAVADVIRDLALHAKAGCLIAHHTGKVGEKGAAPGDMDAGRGASAIRDAVRSQVTLTTMTAKEADDFKIDPDERLDYFRVDSGKLNHGRRRINKPQWFRKVSVRIPNGEDAPAVERVYFAQAESVLAPANLQLVKQAVVHLTETGEWVRYSASPQAKEYLPKVLAKLNEFSRLDLETIGSCLEQLTKIGTLEKIREGRKSKAGGARPLRWRASAQLGAQSQLRSSAQSAE